MIDKMIYLLFRLIRKSKSLQTVLVKKLRLTYYYYISEKRFLIPTASAIGKGFSLKHDLSKNYLTIANDFHCRDYFNITIGHGGVLHIGHHCFFNNHCSINCLGKIEIGDNCQFGENVLLYDHNHRYKDQSSLISIQGYNIGAIKIGNNCWVGSNVVILKGVEIGENVVIGAGCVIYKSIESGTVVTNQQNLLIRKVGE